MSSTLASTPAERTAEVQQQLAEVKSRVQQIVAGSDPQPTFLAVSKFKPTTDIRACYDAGHRDFGENYAQELVEKVPQLPPDIRWHFIGTLQSNKAKLVTSIPNIHTVQSISSQKLAIALNKSLPEDRESPLNVLIQVNTSGEDSKSGLSPQGNELANLARFIIESCPRLYLRGLMTIGSLSEALSDDGNRDFSLLKETRDKLQTTLKEQGVDRWGEGGKLLLSMGMSNDFEAALRAGSDIVRVGSAIFGERPKKGT